MADFWNSDVYNLYGRSVDAIMSDIENMLDALYSNFSKSSTPSNSTTGSQWYDTGTTGGFYNGMKFKSADGNWYKILTGNASFKIWAYRNAALEGWAVDGTVTDSVIALKGAGGSQYGSTGGAPGGTWDLSGMTVAAHVHTLGSHIHQIYDHDQASDLRVFDSNGSPVNTGVPSSDTYCLQAAGYPGATDGAVSRDLYTNAASGNTGSATPSLTGSFRPKAAVGVMIYPLSPS